MKVSYNIVNANLRNSVFSTLNIANIEGFQKINDRQYGAILIDDNGDRRYVRIGVIIADMREDMTADELMQAEIDTYNEKREKAAERARKATEKAAQDAKKRAEKKDE